MHINQLTRTMNARWGGNCADMYLPPQIGSAVSRPLVVAVTCVGRLAVSGDSDKSGATLFVETADSFDLSNPLGPDWKSVAPRFYQYWYRRDSDHVTERNLAICQALAAIGAERRPTVVPPYCPLSLLDRIPNPLPEIVSARARWAWYEQEIERLNGLSAQEPTRVNCFSTRALQYQQLIRDWIAVLERNADLFGRNDLG